VLTMSAQQLISHLGECRRRLSELRGRLDYLALSCAMLRPEVAGATIPDSQHFVRILSGRPYYNILTVGREDTFRIAFSPVASGNITADRIRAALAPVEAITGEILPLLHKLPRGVRERLCLPSNEKWWRATFHLAWHFRRPFLRATRCRLLAKDGVPHGCMEETFTQLYGTGGLQDQLPGLIYSELEHDLCTCSEAAIGVIIEALERHTPTGPLAPAEAQALSADQRRTFDRLRAEFLAGTQLPLPSVACKLLKLADSFRTPPAREWASLEVGGCAERLLPLSRLNDQQEIAQIRGPATEWFCEVAERAANALPALVPDMPILFDQRGFSGPRPVMDRGSLERWLGFVFATLKQHGHEALSISWGTGLGPLSYGLATLDRDLCAASVLAIDLARLTTEAEQTANRERASCSPFSVPSMEEQGLRWSENPPPAPPPPENYTLGQLVDNLRRFGESYHRSLEQIRQENIVVQQRSRIQLGALVSHARVSLQRIPGFTALRELARSLWDEEISFAVGRQIVDALVQRSNGSLSIEAAEGLTLTETVSMLTRAHEGDELPAPTSAEDRQRIVEALETWKRILYPNLPGGPLPPQEIPGLTNRIVAWRDQHAPHFDVTPLDEVRRIQARRATGETTPEEELRTAAERAARVCDRIKGWLQAAEDVLQARTAGYTPSTEISRIVFELNASPDALSPIAGGLVRVPNPLDEHRQRWLPILKECIGRIPDLAENLTEEKLRHWLWERHGVPPTHELGAKELVMYFEQRSGPAQIPSDQSPAGTGGHAAADANPPAAVSTPETRPSPCEAVSTTVKQHFRWLHLTDLHFGMPGQQWLWQNIREEFFRDLGKLHERAGPWDLVLFTGDFVQQGKADEFASLNEFLARLWEHLGGLGSTPILLSVPGNHDLVRPKPADPSVAALRTGWNDPHIQKEFWTNEKSGFRKAIQKAFKNYLSWWNKRPLPCLDAYRPGILPGDFSATLDKVGWKLGIVGLNTTFLQLDGDNYERRLALSSQQFHEACGGDGAAWTKSHHVSILLTHQPPGWLTDESRQELYGEIARTGRFAVHLFGHMHEPAAVALSQGGAEPRREWQGCSLFGLEEWGEGAAKKKRLHGYDAGMIELDGTVARLRHWPRKAEPHLAGHIHIVANTSYTLEDDEGTPPEQIALALPLS
jgi:hypothetical protein